MGGPNSGAKNRKKGDWVAVANGRNNKTKTRWLRDTMRCPMNAKHVITTNNLITHLLTHGSGR